VKGQTVLITGASSGIGRALAREFARGGFHLLLVARDGTALEEVANACRQEFGVEARALACDLSQAGAASRIDRWVTEAGGQVDVLVNNAGFGIHGAFAETPLDRELELVDLQIAVTLRLTKLFLPGMLQRRSGRILNVASVYAFAPVPFQSVYGACKTFLLSFSQALASEIFGRGITITVLCPGSTRTEFRQRAGIREKNTQAGMSAEAVAAEGYRATLAGRSLSVPGAINRLFVFLARHLPANWLGAFVRKINRARGVSR
jgi:short-subunit dehydrogenase